MLNITNCPKCGKLMQKWIRTICPKCYQEIENQYEKCWKFLRYNRKCTLKELSEETGVSTSQITKFIREGRISIAEFENMSYECEVCGSSIRDGHLCDPCRARLVKDISNMKEDEQRQAKLQGERGTAYLKDMD